MGLRVALFLCLRKIYLLPFGSANILIGYQAGQSMGNSAGETPNNNIAIGFLAMESAGDATYNVAVGDNALKNIIGSNNVAIGDQALKDHIDGDSNVAIGYQAMGDAGQDGKTLDHMVAIGTSTLQQLESGYHNIAIGRESQRAIVTGSNNITIGYRTLYQENDVIGSANIVIGSNAGYNANGSSFHANVIIGDYAGYQATNRENVLIGEYAGNDLEDGSQNVVIGANAARFSNTFQSNTNSVLIGHRTQASADGNENENSLSSALPPARVVPLPSAALPPPPPRWLSLPLPPILLLLRGIGVSKPC